MIAITDPAPGSKVDPVPARSSRTFSLLRRDVIIVVKQSLVLVGDRYYSSDTEQLEGLKWLREHNPASRVVLRVDRATPFSQVRRVCAAVSKAGYERITVETQPFKPLFTRRLESRTFHRDRSMLQVPPMDDDGALRLDHMWK